MNAPYDNKRHIYYKINALCVKTWGQLAEINNIYAFTKGYVYKSIDIGYGVISYEIPIINHENVPCNFVIKKDVFDKYFIEIPWSYTEQ